MAKATKSTKGVKPKAEEAAKAEDAVDQSTDVLADALGAARNGSSDTPPENLEQEVKAEEPASEPVEDTSDTPTENDDAEPSDPPEEIEKVEPVEPDLPEEQATVSAPVPVSHPEKKSGFMPLFIGGVLVALLGFGAARTDIFDSMLPESWHLAKAADVKALSTRVEGQTQDVTKLNDEVEKLATPDLKPLESSIAGNTAASAKIQTTLETLSKDISAVDTRLTALEKQPISQGVSKAAIDAYERELKDLQSAVAKQRSETESLLSDAKTMEHNAELTAQDALARAALTRILSAIDSGSPFGAALDDLVSVTGTTPPEGLSAVAQNGVTPLIQLQDQFPGAARAALTASRLDDPDAENGVVAFFTRQLGARSVAPREGSDPDAVLSRAEASLKAGRLNDALAEIETLPPAATPALSDWVAMAKARLAAQNAAETLAQSLNSK